MRRKYRKKKMKRERIPVIVRKPNSDQPFLKSTVDYKNLRLLRQFISSQGKILPRRLTRLTAKEQRNMANAIKTARVIGFLPFINK
jgi:small subunit ribosomal protein S18